jgi:glucose/arabinose dehydrogenase
VTQFATGLNTPRVIVTAPNGDIFLSESYANRIKVLRDANNDGKPEVNETFVDGLKQPFGIAFWPAKNPQWVYIANTDSVVRFPYRNGDTKARGASETIVGNVSAGGKLTGGGHWTRDIVFSPDGRKLYLSIGSLSNVSDDANENVRARIYEYSIGRDGRRMSERTSPGAFATRSDWPFTRKPGNCGQASTSATDWATTSCPIMSPACATAVFMAGRGITSAATKTRVTKANAPTCTAK